MLQNIIVLPKIPVEVFENPEVDTFERESKELGNI